MGQNLNSKPDEIILGFILPKKIVRKSSTRNLIKRWGRELVRRNPKYAVIVLAINSLPQFHHDFTQKNLFAELKTLINGQ
tara:strand:- start:1695 stop:1934 length:240 start_codon:yes stop_codon:yes gene_type:complete